MGSCARVYLLVQKRMRWIFLRGFVVFYYCATAPRPLHGRLILFQHRRWQSLILLLVSYFGQIKCDRSTTTVVFFYVVFTNHDEGWCPLIVCDITWKPSSLLSVRGVWPALYHVHILLLYHKIARVGDRAKNTKKYSASNPDSVGFARSDPHSLWMWWVTNFSGSYWYDSH